MAEQKVNRLTPVRCLRCKNITECGELEDTKASVTGELRCRCGSKVGSFDWDDYEIDQCRAIVVSRH
jgi:hypothetical protein